MIRKISFRDYGSIAAMHGKSIAKPFLASLEMIFLHISTPLSRNRNNFLVLSMWIIRRI